MSINYTLVENNLTEDPGDHTALVHPVGTAEMDDVVERIINQGSTVTRADILGVLEDYCTAVESLVLEGLNVNTPTANFRASIKGVFDGPGDEFDPARHQVCATASPGKRLRKAIQTRGQAAKGERVVPRPNPLEYTDLTTGERNSVLTPGGMGDVIGHRLKHDTGDPAQGVFFIAEDGAETRVDMVGYNRPGHLLFIVPQGLASGDYTLEVRATAYSDGVRAGSLEPALSVA